MRGDTVSKLKLYEMEAVMAAIDAYRHTPPISLGLTTPTLRDALLDLSNACRIVLEELDGQP